MTSQVETNTECCPKFEPDLWDDKLIEWKHKKFIKDKVFTIFYMPLNFGSVMKRITKTVADGNAEMVDGLCLAEHTSKWNMNVYVAVDKEIPEAENTSLSGRFYCKVYEGPFKDSGKWTVDFENVVKSKGLQPKKQYMWYTTCPKCAKKYGKNYVAMLSSLNEN